MAREVILGLHGYSADSSRQMHDAGVCVLIDGEVASAIDEERLSRAKRDGSFPHRAFRAALEVAGVAPEQIDAVAFVDRRTPWQTMQVWRYALDAAWRTGVRPWRCLAFWGRMMLQFRRSPPASIRTRDWSFLEHHRCHAASAYYPGPWPAATVVTLDGMGDFSIGGSVSRGEHGKLELLRRSNGYFSPGHFYMIVTEYLGFTPGRHEGKVTGLAAHGDPERAYAAMERVIRYRPGALDFVAGPVAEEFFNVIRSRPGTRTRQWYSQDQWAAAQRAAVGGYQPQEDVGLDYFRRAWAGYSREDLAAAAQKRFEDVIAAYVTDAVRLVGHRRVAVAGGCFANVRLNQRLAALPDVDGIYVHPNMSDGGLAAGAALLAHHERRTRRRRSYQHRPWPHVFLGPAYSDADIERALRGHRVEPTREPDLAEACARALAAGRVVGWFQGRMEYGPRALGHRSLLAAADDAAMPARLNARLNRSDFMPFAPVILEDAAAEWLRGWQPDHVASRFMTITYDIDPRLGPRVPAVVHVDGTARPQVLRPDDDPLLHRVLARYRELTGLPLVINTSFNMHEEPIVCSPSDAIHAFLRGAADVLAIGPFLVKSAAADTNAGT
jgi:carbamoyltransferase